MKCDKCRGFAIKEECYSEGKTITITRCINCGYVDFGDISRQSNEGLPPPVNHRSNRRWIKRNQY